MPVLDPVQRLEEQSALAPAVRIVKSPLRVPAWIVCLAFLLVGLGAFQAGRHKPAHHYVSYFGYPMVLDTATGKACYASKPKAPEPGSVQDAAFPPVYDGSNRVENYIPNGDSVPMCGQE